MKSITSIALKIFVLVVGLGSLVMGIKMLSVDSSRLIEVQAEVVSSTWQSRDDLGSDSYGVTYTYEVNNISYESSYSSETEYATGTIITVYYDPESPDWSYNSRGETGFLGIVGVLFGLFCIVSLGWGALKNKFSKQGKTATPAEEPGENA